MSKNLKLETDLQITKEDFAVMKNKLRDNRDIGDYIDFLENIGAFETKKPRAKLFDEEFNI